MMNTTQERTCPRCQSGMETFEVGLVTLDRCRQCAGMWFDKGEFDRAVRIITGSYNEKLKLDTILESMAVRRDGGTLKCPACPAHLTLWDMWEPELEIDTCARCKGLWLDGGEFETIQRSVDEKRPSLSPEDLQEIQQRPVGSLGASMVSDILGEMATEDPATGRRRSGWSLIRLLDRILS